MPLEKFLIREESELKVHQERRWRHRLVGAIRREKSGEEGIAELVNKSERSQQEVIEHLYLRLLIIPQTYL